MQYWQNKFAKYNKERDAHKKYLGRTQEISCLTRNTNIKTDDNDGGKSKGKKGAKKDEEPTDNKPSLFKAAFRSVDSAHPFPRCSSMSKCVYANTLASKSPGSFAPKNH